MASRSLMSISRSCYSGTLDNFISSFTAVHDSLGDIAYLTNAENCIVSVSKAFTEQFAIDKPEQLINHNFNKQDFDSLRMYKTNSIHLEEQNNRLRLSKTIGIFLDIINDKDSAKAFVVHKTPVFTNENYFIGMHVRMRPFTFAKLADMIEKIHLPNKVKTNTVATDMPALTGRQRMVIYLYVRNFSYTEISNWMTALGHKISPSRVNEHLSSLKKLLNAKDKYQLREKAVQMGYGITLPPFIPDGSYDIGNAVFDLWVC